MKKKYYLIIACLFFFSPLILFGENSHDSKPDYKYFLVDLNSTQYKVNTVKLNAKSLYNKNIDLEMFNILGINNSLILFTVFPLQNKNLWNKIAIDSVKTLLISYSDLLNDFEKKEKIYISSQNTSDILLKKYDIKIIIKKDNQFMVSSYCLTEFFRILREPLIFPNLMGSFYINIDSPPYTVKQFEHKTKEISNHYSVNSISSKQSSGSSALRRPLEKPLTFFSGSTSVSSMAGYKFWLFSDWRVDDGMNLQRGIDRFIYVPDIGIVAGSFDYWFENFVDSDLIFNNYLNEKIMMPLSINGKVLK